MDGMLKKAILFLGIIISVITAVGCGKEEGEADYASVLSGLSEDQFYAYADLEGNDLPVLLVSDGKYTYEEGIEASIACEVYYIWDGKAERIGKIESAGTAYPVCYDKEGIYAAGGHFVRKYVIDHEKRQLVPAEYAEELFQENGDAVYTYYDRQVEKQAEDDSYLNGMREKYEEASVVDF